MKKNPEPRSGINIPDLIFENLESVCTQILCFVSGSVIISTLDPGWKKKLDPKFLIRDKHPGSAILRIVI
jgi:hypothetical protein